MFSKSALEGYLRVPRRTSLRVPRRISLRVSRTVPPKDALKRISKKEMEFFFGVLSYSQPSSAVLGKGEEREIWNLLDFVIPKCLQDHVIIFSFLISHFVMRVRLLPSRSSTMA